VRVDRYFDLHPWEWIAGKKVPGLRRLFEKDAGAGLPATATQKEVPASYGGIPKERLLAEFRPYFTNRTWRGCRRSRCRKGSPTIGLWGIHYEHDIEHERQRACCEYWVGFLEGRGVQVVIPEGQSGV
jgi:hypothetical protein